MILIYYVFYVECLFGYFKVKCGNIKCIKCLINSVLNLDWKYCKCVWGFFCVLWENIVENCIGRVIMIR